jgi:zinc transport system permease protein
LFGDILATGTRDLWVIYGTAALVLLVLCWQWKPLMRFIIHADIAHVEGINTARLRLLIMLLIALMVAVSIKLVGILLITSLLIVPAATARLIARSPSHMAMMATLASIAAVSGGLAASLYFDTPGGPSIILASLATLGAISLAKRIL